MQFGIERAVTHAGGWLGSLKHHLFGLLPLVEVATLRIYAVPIVLGIYQSTHHTRWRIATEDELLVVTEG